VLGVSALSVLSRVSALGLGVVNDDLVVSKCPGKWDGPAVGVLGYDGSVNAVDGSDPIANVDGSVSIGSKFPDRKSGCHGSVMSQYPVPNWCGGIL
jgi:hypothetical protein